MSFFGSPTESAVCSAQAQFRRARVPIKDLKKDDNGPVEQSRQNLLSEPSPSDREWLTGDTVTITVISQADPTELLKATVEPQ